MKKKEGVQMEKNELQRRFEPAPLQTIKPAASPGSTCLRFVINTSTGRRRTYGFARLWKVRMVFRVG
jgi:hypothetical protein